MFPWFKYIGIHFLEITPFLFFTFMKFRERYVGKKIISFSRMYPFWALLSYKKMFFVFCFFGCLSQVQCFTKCYTTRKYVGVFWPNMNTFPPSFVIITLISYKSIDYLLRISVVTSTSIYLIETCILNIFTTLVRKQFLPHHVWTTAVKDWTVSNIFVERNNTHPQKPTLEYMTKSSVAP